MGCCKVKIMVVEHVPLLWREEPALRHWVIWAKRRDVLRGAFICGGTHNSSKQQMTGRHYYCAI